jgi:hypothetical protein
MNRSYLRGAILLYNNNLLHYFPAAVWPWGFAQPLTEMSIRNLPLGVKRGRNVRLTM